MPLRVGESFATIHFSLLTSRSEGQPLVLLESMAGGCIPIAYNVKYGVADIISHGVNGFLVEPDDEIGLTRQIEELINMPESELLKIRRAAIRRSRDFLPKRIVHSWARELHGAIQRKQSRTAPVKSRAKLGTVRLGDDAIHMRLRVPKALEGRQWEWAKLTWIQRGTRTYGRVPADLSRKDGKLIVRVTVPFDKLAPAWPVSGKPTDFSGLIWGKMRSFNVYASGPMNRLLASSTGISKCILRRQEIFLRGSMTEAKPNDSRIAAEVRSGLSATS